MNPAGVGGVHETAIVDASAALADDVVVGPYTVIGPNVRIGAGTEIGPHVHIVRDTLIGANCRIHHGAALGGDPQDLKYAGEPAELIIGENTIIREFVTLNRGTSAHGKTEIGANCLLMAYAHVAHDCVLGDHVILANSVNMGGHVLIEDYVIVGGLTAIHQFVRIGRHAFVGGSAAVMKDVPPFVKAAGNPLKLYGLNSLGLQRRGFSEETRVTLKRAYRMIFSSSLNIGQALAQAQIDLQVTPDVAHFLAFIEASQRGVTV
ncbi:MAG TPA: acyl-ACP--UDP-N-acetylglucosamine O-acyltransferase [Longimicrobiales bacterium]|nr:acyl-ACP--UDP-N-acetylglucosamine O-acyltransferase [Longimicrobiales bacterium]